MRVKDLRNFLLLTAAFLALIWLAPFAVAMVPGPTLEDDIPPAAEPEQGSELRPETAGPTFASPRAPLVGTIAEYGPEVYGHCMSIGLPNRGALWGGVQFPQANSYYKPLGGGERQWGTPETIDGLIYAARQVHERYGTSPRLVLGDISARGGGRLSPHASHQAGRDADVGYYYRNAAPDTFPNGQEKNIDVRRTWAYVESLVQLNALDHIFMDYAIQAALYDYVKNELHSPPEFLERVFQYPGGVNHYSAIICHAHGHRAHMHLRFNSPVAVANARNSNFESPQMASLQNLAIERESAVANAVALPAPRAVPVEYSTSVRRAYYVVQDGDSLWSIARTNGVTVDQVRAWNGMAAKARLHVGQRLIVYPQKVRLDNNAVAG